MKNSNALQEIFENNEKRKINPFNKKDDLVSICRNIIKTAESGAEFPEDFGFCIVICETPRIIQKEYPVFAAHRMNDDTKGVGVMGQIMLTLGHHFMHQTKAVSNNPLKNK